MFVGLSVLDVLYRLEAPPRANSKNVVRERGIFAGGPAANASVAFAALGGQARVATAVGSHAVGSLILNDLQAHGVTVDDRIPEFAGVPSIASVLVSPNGDRLAASTAGYNLPAPELGVEIADADVLLVDGHLLELCVDAARRAREAGVPVVADCGGWKDGYERLLPYVDVAICAEDFLPPGAHNAADVFTFLRRHDVEKRAITQGERPILVDGEDPVEVPQIAAVDTLGAGDVFHGAYCFFHGRLPFREALAEAGKVASLACETFGTREWISRLGPARSQA